MNGVHDMGGMHSFGPVESERDEPVFHHEWEGRVLAFFTATAFLRKWNTNQFRFAMEQMPPAEYLQKSYYERWLFGIEKLLHDTGLVHHSEVAARLADPTAPAAAVGRERVLAARDVEKLMRTPLRGSRVDEDIPPRFKVGDRVLTRNIHPTGHTRLPRYARGKQGVVTVDHGVWVFDDSRGSGLGRNPQHCYGVRFEGLELWGESAGPRDAVYIDLWDDHLTLA
jgi:nitrile hydratase subunit beta